MSNRYEQAGVNLDAGAQAVSLMKAAVQSTFTPEVLSNVGNFGGLFDVSALKSMHAPVLVSSTDGVGTKTRVAAFMQRWDTIGQDLVNHCINDILVQGAKPLFFLDYVASDKLNPEQIAAIVGGMAEGCRAAGCALIGGETAEMPGVYTSGEIDVVGTIIGVVDRADIINGKRIKTGDVILGLPSTGLHTNGFSLAREVLKALDWNESHPSLGTSPGEAMLAVHRCYMEEINQLRISEIDIRGLAHITGGGIIDNLPRILPEGLGAEIHIGTWSAPPIFELIQNTGGIAQREMFRVFNMGLGMLVVIPAEEAEHAGQILSGDCFQVGEIIAGTQGVTLR